MKKYKKLNLSSIFLGIVLCFLLCGCSSDSNEKYSAKYIQENSGITMENKLLQIENNSIEMYEAGTNGSFYMETQKRGNDYSIAYDVGGYELGLFCVNGKKIAFSVMGDEYNTYEIDGDVNESIMVSDFNLIEKIMDINYKSSKIGILHLAGDPYKTETVSGNDGDFIDLEIDEDVVLLSDNEFEYILYLNPESGKCNRFQAIQYDDKGEMAEEFFVILRDLSPNSPIYPDGIESIEDFEEMSGEEFSTFSSNFLFSAMANASFSNSEQNNSDDENEK